jgi:tetratricopeptide (TPR) repeat protein
MKNTNKTIVTFVAIITLFAGLCAGQAFADSSSPDSLFSMGYDAYQSKDYLGAISYYSQAINAGLDTYAVYYNRGLAYYQEKDYAEAEQDFNYAIYLNPNYADAKNMLKQAQAALHPSNWLGNIGSVVGIISGVVLTIGILLKA